MLNTYFTMHNHSMFSYSDGYATPNEYLDRATQIGLKGFAITEHGNQSSWLYFDKIKQDYKDIKMVYGIEFYMYGENNDCLQEYKYYHFLILAKNEKGRKTLNQLQRKSNEHYYYKSRINIDMFKDIDCNNLIVCSACLNSLFRKNMENKDKCVEILNKYKEVFPNFYLELQSHHHNDQKRYNKFLYQLANQTGTPYVITTDSHYSCKDDEKYQARHVQIAHDSDTITEVYEGCYLQTVEEIHECMDSQMGFNGVEKGLQETLNILDMIEIVDMPWSEPKLPLFEVPKEFNSEFEYIKHLVYNVGWKERNLDKLTIEQETIYKERTEEELGVINKTGYVGYFLIVWDFIKYAKDNKISIGAGRGSACSSCVNWLLGITQLDPIKYDLVFSRFLNEERISLPDIDSDFGNRKKIIDYLSDKYGTDKVALVCNFNYITPLVAIKNVGKILGISYSITTKIGELFTDKKWIDCVENNKKALEKYAEYSELFEIASHLSGRVNTFGSHACGLVIARTSLDDYLGSNLNTGKEYVVNVDKRLCENIGLVKFDILGVSNLEIVQDVIDEVGLNENVIDVNNEEFINDKKTYELICSGKTDAIFQLESAGMKDLCKRIQPKNIRDVSDILALYRPDALGSLNDYILNKYDHKLISYWCDEVRPILEVTHGVLIYQEQMLSIVREIGGRTYGGADKFRKGVGKKDLKLVQKEADQLRNEIIENGFTEEIADIISSYLRSFGGYLFCLSHSMGYSVLTLQTAYLKAHYPLYFFKALLNQNSSNYGNINRYILDAQDCNVQVEKPNINHSQLGFAVVNDKILFGLNAINGIGNKLVNNLIETRNKGKFKNIKDFINRVAVSKSQVVALIKSGAIPCQNKHTTLIRYAHELFKTSEYKNVTTFTMSLDKANMKYNVDFKPLSKEERLVLLNKYKKTEYDVKQKQKYEKHMDSFQKKYLTNDEFWEFETLSIFLNNNPFVKAVEKLTPLEKIEDGNSFTTVGVIADIQKKKDKNKNEYCFMNLYSANGIYEIACWSSQYKQYVDFIKKGNKIAILCTKREETLTMKEIKDYDQWIIDCNL